VPYLLVWIVALLLLLGVIIVGVLVLLRVAVKAVNVLKAVVVLVELRVEGVDEKEH
jgi:hypothetical protein